MKSGKPEICRAGGRLETHGRAEAAVWVQRLLGGTIPSPQGWCLWLSGWNPTTQWRISFSAKSTDWNVGNMKHPFVATCRVMFDQVCGYRCLAKLTPLTITVAFSTSHVLMSDPTAPSIHYGAHWPPGKLLVFKYSTLSLPWPSQAVQHFLFVPN